MFCNHCGTRIESGQRFCQACGAEVIGAAGPEAASASGSAQPPATGPGVPRPAQTRLERHVRLLGAMWLVYSGLRLIGGVAALFVGSVVLGGFARHFRPGFPFGPHWEPRFGPPFFIPALVSGVGVLLLIAAIAGLAAGFGLLNRRSWARPAALILGALSMLSIPIGTALGFYTFWVLLPAGAEQEYRAMAGA